MDISIPQRANKKRIEVFCCYARKDQQLLLELKVHLAPLQQEGLITLWADIDISAGIEWEKEIHRHLDTAQIILLLVSPNFIASDYCYSIEMKKAMERHEHDETRVIPVILRHVYWQGAPFGKIQALPTDGKPIQGPSWHSHDEAFFNVVEGIRKVVETFTAKPQNFQEVQRKEETFQKRIANALPKQPSETQENMLATLNPQSSVITPPSPAGDQTQQAPVVPIPSNSPSGVHPTPERHLSRRTLILGLSLTGIAGLGTLIWFTTPHGSGSHPSQNSLLYTYTGHSYPVSLVLWSFDGKRIASTSQFQFGKDGTIHVWDAPSGGHLYKYGSSKDSVTMFAWAPHELRILSALSASDLEKVPVQAWDAIDGGHRVGYLDIPGNGKLGVTDTDVYAIAWSPDGKQIVAGDEEGLCVWDAKTQNVLWRDYSTLNAHPLAWSPNGQFLASIAGADETVMVWDAIDRKQIYTYTGHEAALLRPQVNNTSTAGILWTLAWSPDSQKIASGGDDEIVQVWDAFNGHLTYSYPGHSDRVEIITWSPDGQRIASGSKDGTVLVWKADDGGHPYTCNNSYSVAWSPDGKQFATGSGDGTVKIWNTSTGQIVQNYEGHTGSVIALAWSPNSRYIVSGSIDTTVKVWQAR